MQWASFVVFFCVAFCNAQDLLPWWRTAVFYQVYPRSFKDSDGDGVGDLKGITEEADYFKDIGVDAIWLSPINQSPMSDFGYDISNFTAIDPLFGTMDDFDALVKKLKEIDVKLLLDFVPNHSSDEHPWFVESAKSNPDYKDFYVWMDGKPATSGTLPPNNWCSIFGGSAWQWNNQTEQYYLHKFQVKQPDLNYRSDNLKGNMTAAMNFWLDRGVDGFRVDAVKFIFEDAKFPDAPPVPGTAGDTYDTQLHIYDENQRETYELLRYWADMVSERVQTDGRQRALFLEVYETLPMTMKYYAAQNQSFEFPFNFFLLTQGNRSSTPGEIKKIIDDWLTAMPTYGVANWVVGNHDNGRVADRYGAEMVDAINLLTSVLPGVKVVYNGEEIGMTNTFVTWNQTMDPSGKNLGPYDYMEASRDPERTPMQWDNTPYSGFSTNASTWLPVNPNYWWLNVEAQKAAETSHLKVFQAMAKAKKDPVLQMGNCTVLVPDSDTLIVLRGYNESYFVLIINMGSDMLNYTSETLFAPNGLDADMTVVVGSINSGYQTGINLQKGSLSVTLRPKAAILLRSGTSSSSRIVACMSTLIFTILSLLKR